MLLKTAMVGSCSKTSVGTLKRSVEEKLISEAVSTREEETTDPTRWLKRDAWRSRHRYVREIAFWTEDFEKA